MPRQLIFLQPPLDYDKMSAVTKALSINDRVVGYADDEDIYFQEKAGKVVLAKGPSQVIAESGVQLEAVLPKGIPASRLADTVRYFLNRVNAQDELLIIDPYLFPANASQDYMVLVEAIVGATLDRVSSLHIVTKADRNTAVEAAFDAMVNARNPSIVKTTKYTNDFHDRFWIGDKVRGLFIGTSLNGIGNRYSIADYLRDEDTAEIYSAFRALT